MLESVTKINRKVHTFVPLGCCGANVRFLPTFRPHVHGSSSSRIATHKGCKTDAIWTGTKDSRLVLTLKLLNTFSIAMVRLYLILCKMPLLFAQLKYETPIQHQLSCNWLPYNLHTTYNTKD